MADYGMLGGLAEGIKQGLLTYRDESRYRDEMKRRAEDEALKKKMYKADMFSKGLMESKDIAYDPAKGLIETDTFEYTPEKLAQIEREKEKMALENRMKEKEFGLKERELGLKSQELGRRGIEKEGELFAKGLLTKKDASGKVIGFERDPSYQGADQLGSLLKSLQVRKLTEELGDKQIQRESPEAKFKKLPVENQEQIKTLSKTQADRKSIRSALSAGLEKLQSDQVSEEQKLVTARQMIKALNSTQGQDAVGEGEAARLAGLLEFRFFNVTEPGPMFGRAPIGDFAKQVENKVGELDSMVSSGEQEINKLYGGNRPGNVADQPKDQDADAMAYAQMHGLPYDQAKAILDARKSKAAKK